MPKPLPTLLAAALLALGLALASGAERPDYDVTTHKVVLITDEALNPQRVEMEEGKQVVAWISYSPLSSTIVFDREVARSMICHSYINFQVRDGELRSAPIQTGEFASFCELAPGTYRYRVVRASADAGAKAPPPLQGEIVVSRNP